VAVALAVPDARAAATDARRRTSARRKVVGEVHMVGETLSRAAYRPRISPSALHDPCGDAIRGSVRTALVELTPRSFDLTPPMPVDRARRAGARPAAVARDWLDVPCAARRAGAEEGTDMLHWAIIFFVIALIAAVLGQRGVAGLSAQIGYLFVGVAVILLLVALLAGHQPAVVGP
jgi:uncharacterized membrane protein YtjA (UPF0391 family)